MNIEKIEFEKIKVLELTNFELLTTQGGEAGDHLGYWVSLVFGVPIHQIWMAGYIMGSNP